MRLIEGTAILCPLCKTSYLARESISKYGQKTYTNNGKLFNLHCWRCDNYYIENWRELNYFSFESTMRRGPSLRRERRKIREGHEIGTQSAPYCLIRYHKPFPIPRDFHEMYVRYREAQRKKLMA
jgi:hypothetical protein